MAKRKGPSTSRPRARNKAAKEGTEAKISERGAAADDDKEYHQLTREFSQLEGRRAKLSEKEQELGDKLEEEELNLDVQRLKMERQERKVEELKRDMEERLQSLRCGLEQSQRKSLPKKQRLKDLCSAWMPRTLSGWTSSQRKCGRRSSMSSARTTSSPWP